MLSWENNKNSKDIDFEDLEWAEDFMASQKHEPTAAPKPKVTLKPRFEVTDSN